MSAVLPFVSSRRFPGGHCAPCLSSCGGFRRPCGARGMVDGRPLPLGRGSTETAPGLGFSLVTCVSPSLMHCLGRPDLMCLFDVHGSRGCPFYECSLCEVVVSSILVRPLLTRLLLLHYPSCRVCVGSWWKVQVGGEVRRPEHAPKRCRPLGIRSLPPSPSLASCSLVGDRRGSGGGVDGASANESSKGGGQCSSPARAPGPQS